MEGIACKWGTCFAKSGRMYVYFIPPFAVGPLFFLSRHGIAIATGFVKVD